MSRLEKKFIGWSAICFLFTIIFLSGCNSGNIKPKDSNAANKNNIISLSGNNLYSAPDNEKLDLVLKDNEWGTSKDYGYHESHNYTTAYFLLPDRNTIPENSKVLTPITEKKWDVGNRNTKVKILASNESSGERFTLDLDVQRWSDACAPFDMNSAMLCQSGPTSVLAIRIADTKSNQEIPDGIYMTEFTVVAQTWHKPLPERKLKVSLTWNKNVYPESALAETITLTGKETSRINSKNYAQMAGGGVAYTIPIFDKANGPRVAIWGAGEAGREWTKVTVPVRDVFSNKESSIIIEMGKNSGCGLYPMNSGGGCSDWANPLTVKIDENSYAQLAANSHYKGEVIVLAQQWYQQAWKRYIKINLSIDKIADSPFVNLATYIDRVSTSKKTECKDFSGSWSDEGTKVSGCLFQSQDNWPGANFTERKIWKHGLILAAPDSAGRNPKDYIFVSISEDLQTSQFYQMVKAIAKKKGKRVPAIKTDCTSEEYPYCTVLDIIALVSNVLDMPVAAITAVPNQMIPIKSITGEGSYKRFEDDLIAETIAHVVKKDYYMGGIAYFPMSNAIIKGMREVRKITTSADNNELPPAKQFILVGESKRSWASWLATAYDQLKHENQIKGLISLVIPFNFKAVLTKIRSDYLFPADEEHPNGWPAKLKEYQKDNMTGYNRNILDGLISNREPYLKLNKDIDVYYFLESHPELFRNLPILSIAATHDAYFTPEAPQYYLPSLWFNKSPILNAPPRNSLVNFMELPNLGHQIVENPEGIIDLVPYALSVLNFTSDVINNKLNKLPQVMFKYDEPAGRIKVSTKEKPESIILHCAGSSNKLDYLDMSKTKYEALSGVAGLNNFVPPADETEKFFTQDLVIKDVIAQIKPDQCNKNGSKFMAIELEYHFNHDDGDPSIITSPVYIVNQ